MSFTLAHLSDLHLAPMPRPRPWQLASKRILGFQSWHLRRKSLHRLDVLESFIDKLKELKPDRIVITGDVVNIGLPAEFEASIPWLERFEQIAPLSLVPGNHDAYTADALTHWHLWQRWMGGSEPVRFPYVTIQGPVRLIGLSSAIPSPWGRAWGRIGAEQLQELRELLEQPHQGWTILLLHHPAFKGASLPRKSLLDQQQLQEALEGFEVDLILSGHEHKHQFGIVPSSLAEVQAITVPSASIAHDNPTRTGGFNLLTLHDVEKHGQMKLAGFEQWRYDPVLTRPVRRMAGRLARDGKVWTFDTNST